MASPVPAPTAPAAPPDPRAGKRANWQSYESNAAAGALEVSHKPVQLFLEITSRCNLRCAKCGFAWDPELAKNGKDIAWPLLARMEDFFEAATEVYTFGYGEMFLYPELAPLITVLKNHHCRVSGVTNGTMIRPADVVWLVATGYDHLAFSIDGATEETMDRLRGASHKKILNVLRLIHEEKQRRQSKLPNIVVNFVAQADNFRELPELVRQLAPLGIFFLGVNPLHHFNDALGGYEQYYDAYRLSHVDRAEWEAVIGEARGLAEGAGMIFENFVNPDFEWRSEAAPAGAVPLHVHATPAPAIETAAEPPADAAAEVSDAPPARLPVLGSAPAPSAPLAPALTPMYCHYPWTTLYLSASGTAKVCCYMGVKEGLGSFTGEGGIGAVWNGRELQSVREHIREGRVHPACTQCVAHRSFENHAAAMNPIRAELFPPAPPAPAPAPVETAPEEPEEPEITGLRRILRKVRARRAASSRDSSGAST
jgi:MoaA/NifB/PqqE/SkfB family radical SAM enzyme